MAIVQYAKMYLKRSGEYNTGMEEKIPFREDFSNKRLAKLFSLIAAVYMLNGENRFKIIAYQKAAESVEHLAKEIYNVWEEGKIKEIPGFGSSIGASLDELFRTGKSNHFDAVLAGVPKSLPVVMEVPGIGPKKAIRLINEFQLYDENNVLRDIVQLANEGRIAGLDGFGKKSEIDIKESVELYLATSVKKVRMPLPIAGSIADKVAAYLSQIKGIQRIDYMGSLRRQLSTIGDVDVSVMAPQEIAQEIVDHFLTIPGKLSVEGAGDTKASIIFPPNVRVDLRVTTPEQYGSMLQYFTGSKQHNINLREYALKKGYSLNEYGIKDTTTAELHTFQDEKGFYNFLDLDYIPPEIREGTTEIALAKKHELPNLVSVDDIKGDFHIHSSYDIKTSHDVGVHTYKEIAETALELGYDYVGFADHNPKQVGHSEEEIVEVMKLRKMHIDQVLKDVKIDYYISLEVDILPSGNIALPEKAVDYVDFLIVSIHSSFTQSRDEQTERILKALSHPKVKLFGHPTGRLINKREGVQLNWPKVFAYAAEKGIALEVNSSPQRLDLPDGLVREGKEAGCKFFIDTDSHDIHHMKFMKYGVGVARRGWLTKEDVVNTWSREKLREFLTS